jgi:transposase
MSNEYRHVELLTGDVRRRRWTTEQKLTIIEQSFEPGETVSSTARRHGVAPNLLYRWRRLLSEGGAAAVDSDEPVVGNSEVKKLEDRVRELERMLGRKTMEVEILREALSKADSKNGYRGRSCCRRTVRDEGRRRHAGCFPFQSDRAAERQIEAARLL